MTRSIARPLCDSRATCFHNRSDSCPTSRFKRRNRPRSCKKSTVYWQIKCVTEQTDGQIHRQTDGETEKRSR